MKHLKVSIGLAAIATASFLNFRYAQGGYGLNGNMVDAVQATQATVPLPTKKAVTTTASTMRKATTCGTLGDLIEGVFGDGWGEVRSKVAITGCIKKTVLYYVKDYDWQGREVKGKQQGCEVTNAAGETLYSWGVLSGLDETRTERYTEHGTAVTWKKGGHHWLPGDNCMPTCENPNMCD